MFYSVVLLLLIGFASSNNDVFEPQTRGLTPVSDECETGPPGRVPWILHRRQDYGWGEHTPRAIISLAVNKYKASDADWRRMDLQLEVEITKALLRNNGAIIHDNDLALIIHALIARNKNPRDFHGIDLVGDLLQRVNNKTEEVHPFLILALCNSGIVEFDHLYNMSLIAKHGGEETRQDLEKKALALKAFACAVSRDPNWTKFSREMKSIVECLLKRRQGDGSFGNAYTTALAVQALTAHDAGKNWGERKALDFLEKEAIIKVNMIKAYYIEMALNARSVTFIKDLAEIPFTVAGTTTDEPKYFLQYTIKTEEMPEVYHTISIKVPETFNFYDVMKRCSDLNPNFKFDNYLNEAGNPIVYSVAGIPNDAEEDLFWRLCVQKDVNHNRHDSVITEHMDSPKLLNPKENYHIIYWYRNSECPRA